MQFLRAKTLVLVILIASFSQAGFINYTFTDYWGTQAYNTANIGYIWHRFHNSTDTENFTLLGESYNAGTMNWTGNDSAVWNFTDPGASNKTYITNTTGSYSKQAISWCPIQNTAIKLYVGSIETGGYYYISNSLNGTLNGKTDINYSNVNSQFRVYSATINAGNCIHILEQNGKYAVFKNITIEIPIISPQAYTVSANNSIAGYPAKLAANWSSSYGLSSYTLSVDNGTGSYVNITTKSFTGLSNWSNETVIIPTNYGKTFRFIYYAYDSLGVINATDATTFTILGTQLNISAYDENGNNAPKQFNLTISNSTNSTNYQVNYGNAPVFNQSVQNTPVGALTITLTNASCQTGNIIPRTVYGNTANGNLTFNVSMLCDGTNAVSEIFAVYTSSAQPIGGAVVNLTRTINGVNNTVAVLTTDSTGTAQIYLTQSANYYYTVSATGYQPATAQITAIGGTINVFLVNAGGSGYASPYGLNLVNYSIVPTNVLGYPLFGFNFSINGSVNYYALNVSLGNGTVLCFKNYTNSTGGPINDCNGYNRTDWVGTAYGAIYFQVPNYQPFNFTVAFSFMNYTNTNSSLTGILTALDNSDMSPSMKLALALFGALIFAGGGMVISGASGAGLAFILAFSFFSMAVGFVSNELFYIILVVGLAIYFIRQGWG